MKGWQQIEVQEELNNRLYRLTFPVGSPSTDVSAILKKWADEFDEMFASAKENADSSAGVPSFVPVEENKPKEESAPLPEQE